MRYVFDDGGRAAAGFRGRTGDCVVRAIAIALRLDYGEVYRDLKARMGKGKSPRDGVPTKVIHRYLSEHGWTWTPTMRVGQGCRVHLRPDELPSGRIIVRVTRHVAAVIDGVLHDTHNSTRGGTRCVYGYWRKA